MLTRRNFILSSAAFVACGTAAAKGRDMKNPDLKLGVISDIHIRRPEDVKVVRMGGGEAEGCTYDVPGGLRGPRVPVWRRTRAVRFDPPWEIAVAQA